MASGSRRWSAVEKVFHQAKAYEPSLTLSERLEILKKDLEPMLYRDLQHRGVVTDAARFSPELIGWIEVA